MLQVQLELVTSESFDVYSPELEALNSSRNSLPPVTEMPKDTAAKKGEPEHPYTPRTVIVSDEPLPDEGIIETLYDYLCGTYTGSADRNRKRRS